MKWWWLCLSVCISGECGYVFRSILYGRWLNGFGDKRYDAMRCIINIFYRSFAFYYCMRTHTNTHSAASLSPSPNSITSFGEKSEERKALAHAHRTRTTEQLNNNWTPMWAVSLCANKFNRNRMCICIARPHRSHRNIIIIIIFNKFNREQSFL